MKVLRLTVQSSLKGGDLLRPAKITLMLPNNNDTDLGYHASVQTTTGRRRALKTGRSILDPVGTTITTRALNRGARPWTRLVPAFTPRLVSATAGATLGAPSGIAIPGLVGFRGLLRTNTGARPTGARSTGLLRPPRIVLLPLLVDVQQAPELVVHAGTGPPSQDRLQSAGVPHQVSFCPGEQVVRRAAKQFDDRDQEHAGGKPSRRPTEALDKTRQSGVTLRPQCRGGIRQA